MKNKWKNIKASARRRDALIKQAQTKTGGGKLTAPEKRIIESQSYADIANKLGISAKGNEARFDSDNVSGASIEPPTRRLKRALREKEPADDIFVDEDSRMSTSSAMSTDSVNTTFEDVSDDHATPSSSNHVFPTMSAPSNESSEAAVNPKKKKKPNAEDYSSQFKVNLEQQQKNNLLQKQYLEVQIERSQIAKEREILEKRLVQMKVDKEQALMDIELDKQRQLAALEIEAKRREYGL